MHLGVISSRPNTPWILSTGARWPWALSRMLTLTPVLRKNIVLPPPKSCHRSRYMPMASYTPLHQVVQSSTPTLEQR